MYIPTVNKKDWFPKLDLLGGHIGDKYPLCEDLPLRSFLRKHAVYRLLGGSPRALWYYEPEAWYQDGNKDYYQDREVVRFKLDSNSTFFTKLCNPKDPAPAPPTTTLQAANSTEASYNSSVLGAPFCSGSGRKCDSGTILEGNNASSPYTLDTCMDGTSDAEAVQKIIVESVKDGDMRGGEQVKIRAFVTTNSIKDRVDFYYTENAASPDWVHITTVAPENVPASNEVTLKRVSQPYIIYTLPKCTKQAGCKQVRKIYS